MPLPLRAIAAVVILAGLVGCKASTVTGGQSRHDVVSTDVTASTQPSITVTGLHEHRKSGEMTVRLLAGDTDITVTDSRDRVSTSQPTTVIVGGQDRHAVTKADDTATTQPSITLTGDKTTLSTNNVKEGELGGFHFQTQEVKTNPTAWGLIGILLAAGVAFYFLGNIPGMIVSGAGVVLAFVYPAALVWIALACVAWVIWAHRDTISQIVTGNQKALDSLPSTLATAAKGEMQKAQAPNVQAVVKAIRPKPASPAATT